MYVGRTQKKNVEWPSFEVSFLEKFQIYLFRKPASIEFRIYMGTFRPVKVDSIKIDIPGENANTLTSSSTLYREVKFGRRTQAKPKQTTPVKSPINAPAENEPLNKSPSPTKTQRDGDNNAQDLQKTVRDNHTPTKGEVKDGTMTGTMTGTMMDKQQNDAEKAPEIITGSVAGLINYKAEWSGYGSSLPPSTIDKLSGSKQDGIKIKNYYEKDMENIVDVNDPRNELAIQQLKQLKNKQIHEVLRRDAMMPFSDFDSLRHRLYKLKFHKIDLVNRRIPLTEQEIYGNPDLLRFIAVNPTKASLSNDT